WWGFSVSGGYYEDDEWDVAVKYAADWNNFKVSAAYGFTENTDEGCQTATAPCTGLANAGGGGRPFQGFRKDVESNQVGASVMHVPTGLWVYGMYQHEENSGTPWTVETGPLDPVFGTLETTRTVNVDTNTWYMKGGIKRTWLPLGATVL